MSVNTPIMPTNCFEIESSRGMPLTMTQRGEPSLRISFNSYRSRWPVARTWSAAEAICRESGETKTSQD